MPRPGQQGYETISTIAVALLLAGVIGWNEHSRTVNRDHARAERAIQRGEIAALAAQVRRLCLSTPGCER